LNVWHLAKRMFFAGYAKEKRAERNSDDALAEKASHNALPQLSVSGIARKDESAVSVTSVIGSLRSPQCEGPRQRPVILNGVKDLSQAAWARYLACVFQVRIVRSLAVLGMTREWNRQRCIRDD